MPRVCTLGAQSFLSVINDASNTMTLDKVKLVVQ